MLRPRTLAGAFLLSAVAALLLLAIGAPVSHGATSAGLPASLSPVALPAPAPVGCAQSPAGSEAPVLALDDGGVCRADATEDTALDSMRVFGARTCRCS